MSPHHPEPRRARSAGASPAWLAVGVTLALAGCSNAAPTLSAQPSASAAPSASTTPSSVLPAERALVPEGTAEENLPLFSDVVAAVWATPDNVAGRAYIDALITAGFDRSAMQVTPDQSTVGNPAESIQFSVRWGDKCLVGQVGPATGTPVTVVVPVLGEGSCLVGQTRPIDW